VGIRVVEVERPKRRHLKRNGKSDPKDAETAARAVLAGEVAGVPKSADGKVEMIRTLRSARRSAVKARVQAANQLQAILVTAPEGLRPDVWADSRRKNWSRSPPASVPVRIPRTSKRPPGWRCVRWPAATRYSPRRLRRWTSSSSG
jgi:hypothetical protein